MKRIHVVGTADTKGDELRYLAERITMAGGAALVVDVGTRAPTIQPDISAAEVASHGPADTLDMLASCDRGRAVAAMTQAYAQFVTSRNDIAGIVGIGGGGGTSIITAGMRQLPLGLPKIMVSTLASGDVSAYVGVSDIMMMPAVTDMTGLNRISRVILANAARAIAAMTVHLHLPEDGKAAIGLTMFGVTTACVSAIVERLKGDYDCLVFHATGTGGHTMEKLADSGLLSGVLDITMTEICDLLFGGVLPAKEDRLDVIARTKLPYVGSVGALDMVNFWAPDTVPERHRDRVFYNHNTNVTLMRTTPRECRQVGEWIAKKLNRCSGPIRFLIPEKGVSALDVDDGPFADAQADRELFTALEETLEQTPNRQIARLPYHINDPEFSEAAVAAFREISRN